MGGGTVEKIFFEDEDDTRTLKSRKEIEKRQAVDAYRQQDRIIEWQQQAAKEKGSNKATTFFAPRLRHDYSSGFHHRSIGNTNPGAEQPQGELIGQSFDEP